MIVQVHISGKKFEQHIVFCELNHADMLTFIGVISALIRRVYKILTISILTFHAFLR